MRTDQRPRRNSADHLTGREATAQARVHYAVSALVALHPGPLPAITGEPSRRGRTSNVGRIARTRNHLANNQFACAFPA